MDKKNLANRLHALVFVLVYIFGWGAVNGGEIRCIEKERKALLRFKKDIIDEHNILSSWGSEEDKWECCKWNGILCSNRTGHVISLQLVGLAFGEDGRLEDLSLRGNISSVLLELPHLIRLNLSYNVFLGKEIPEFIGSLKKLKHLNLRSCWFGGIVPHQLGNLTNLRTLDLGHNMGLMIDNLKWLSRLSSLYLLDLSGVNFIGGAFETIVIQDILKLSSSLKELYLSNSQFSNVTSSFDDVFVNSTFTSLSILDLSNIGLTSFAFRWLFNITTSFVHLDLSENHLDGPIPDGFGKLISLEYLDMSENELDGPIPGDFGKLISLEYLDLSENKIDGSIPDNFGELTSLRYLYLSHNRLEGGISKPLWNLSRLQTLRASNNHLTEPLSNSFQNLTGKVEMSLRILDLFNNEITGSLPDFRQFSALEELDLYNNKLKNLPASVGELSKLERLDVSFNSIEGTIFEAHLSKLHNLKVLDLSFNSLAINLTHDWIPPFRLAMISLAHCNVGPRFPAWLQTQSNFSLLDLSFSNISDELPKWFWDLSFRLDYLDLSHNQISGRLPNLSSNFARDPVIDLSYNIFSGLVPTLHPKHFRLVLSNNMFIGPFLFQCTVAYNSLQLLDLSNNQLFGELPNCWQNMTSLMVLNLANNNFSGRIPQTLGSLQALLRLHLRNNKLSGELPSSLKKCQRLAMIDVGGNKLTGSIPEWIGSYLTELIVLSFRGNSFLGSIPPVLCHLTRIQILDFSRNNLSGTIPPQCFNNFTSFVQKNSTSQFRFGFLTDGYHHSTLVDMIDNALVQWKEQEFEYTKILQFLTLIDLSSNRIVGNIPPEIIHLRGLASLNLSRNHLTGSISSDIDQMEMLQSLDLSRNHLSGNIPIGLGKLTFLQVLDLSNNNLSGKIPSSTQLQSFNASAYDGNIELCGPPLRNCPEGGLGSSSGNHGKHDNEDDFTTQSILREFYIPVVLGFIVGFWGTIATLILKKTWRYAYFNFFSNITDWVYVKAAIYVRRLR